MRVAVADTDEFPGAVDSLWLYKTNGNFSGGGTAPVLTGPAFVTKDNVDTVAKFAAKGTR